jgi:large subunit ribosomal protein L31e
MIKEFAIKHLKSSQIKIDQDLNRYIWQKGKTNPPRKVRVRIVKDEDDQVIVSLYEDVINESISASSTKEDTTDLNTESSNTNDNSSTKDIDKESNTKLK